MQRNERQIDQNIASKNRFFLIGIIIGLGNTISHLKKRKKKILHVQPERV